MGARAKFIHRARLSPREPGLAVADFSAFNPLKSRFLKIAFAFLCFDHVAGNLSKAGWSLGCVSAVDSQGRTIWIADAHRDDGKRFVVRADETTDPFSRPLVNSQATDGA